jgi:hypothetical protein
MADIIIKVITPATNFALLTLAEAKTLLGIPAADVSSDEQLTQLINWYSAYVSQIANRVFAKEKLSETWYDLQDRRVFLSHFPVKAADVHSVEAPRGTVLDPSAYELEEGSGKIRFKSVPVSQPIVVTYTGGYVLPDEAPDDLKNAASILVRRGRTEAQREATAGIRSISHKDQRVMFFDPNQSQGGGAASQGGGVSVEAIRAVHALLYHYSRLEV